MYRRNTPPAPPQVIARTLERCSPPFSCHIPLVAHIRRTPVEAAPRVPLPKSRSTARNGMTAPVGEARQRGPAPRPACSPSGGRHWKSTSPLHGTRRTAAETLMAPWLARRRAWMRRRRRSCLRRRRRAGSTSPSHPCSRRRPRWSQRPMRSRGPPLRLWSGGPPPSLVRRRRRTRGPRSLAAPPQRAHFLGYGRLSPPLPLPQDARAVDKLTDIRAQLCRKTGQFREGPGFLASEGRWPNAVSVRVYLCHSRECRNRQQFVAMDAGEGDRQQYTRGFNYDIRHCHETCPPVLTY